MCVILILRVIFIPCFFILKYSIIDPFFSPYFSSIHERFHNDWPQVIVVVIDVVVVVVFVVIMVYDVMITSVFFQSFPKHDSVGKDFPY